MSHLLLLRKILSGTQSINFEQEWALLGKDDNPAILVYGDTLSAAVLKCPNIVPANLVEYYYGILGLKKGSFPNIETLFSHAPLLLSGIDHLNARKIFAKKYKAIEKGLIHWLPQFTMQFIQSHLASSDPVQIALDYVNAVFRNIAARDLAIKESDIPIFPERFMTLYPDKDRLTKIEEHLADLRLFYENRLKELGRDPNDAQMLMTINVVGGEPLEAALCYGLMNLSEYQLNWDARTLFHNAVPVNFFGRIANEDVCINGINFKKGQEVFTCPGLIHQHVSHHCPHSETSYSFGKGLHLCLGQGISIEIANCFFPELARQKIQFDKLENTMKFVRDNINLRIKKEKIHDAR